MDRGGWQPTVHGVTKNWTWLKWLSTHTPIKKKESNQFPKPVGCMISISLSTTTDLIFCHSLFFLLDYCCSFLISLLFCLFFTLQAYCFHWLETLYASHTPSLPTLCLSGLSQNFLKWFTRLTFWRRKWQTTPLFLPGESQGWGSLVGCHLWGLTESDATEVT